MEASVGWGPVALTTGLTAAIAICLLFDIVCAPQSLMDLAAFSNVDLELMFSTT